MAASDLSAPCYPGDDILDRLGHLLNEGRALDAWALARDFAPLREWVKEGPLPAFYASRLFAWLGNRRRSAALDRVASRLYPESPEVFLRGLSEVGRREGLLVMLERVREVERHPRMEERHRFFLLNLEGDLWSLWSDFDRALACLDRAEGMRPGHDRTLVERARVLMRADRREEAEGCAREAMRVRPGNVTAPQILAELLRSAGREEEARRVLEEAMERVQDADVVLALANWHSEHGGYAEALRLSEEYERLVPLADAAGRRWLAGWRSFRMYLAKDYAGALEQARLCPKGFIAEIADRLRTEEPGRRVRLAVPFVKQDRRTCGPATLAAICGFHGDEAEQVEIAEAICYDGTPDHSERHWAEERGYAVREFRVTPETVRALIDKGLPFTLTTVEPASAHLQAVIGYDTKADTLLVREPGWADNAEYRMGILEDYAFSGPRGMVMVPRGKEGLLEGVDLPEAGMYDFLHGLQRALHGNDRGLAVAFLERLRGVDAGHRLTLLGERRLAGWDRNVPGQMAGVDGMLGLYPEQPALLYEKLWLLAATAGRQEQMAFARRVQGAGKAPPEVDRLLAELLDDDAREWPAAEGAWRRAVRRSGLQAGTLSGLADFRWSQQRRREAVLYYRLAACVEVLSEGAARSYFNAARWLGPVEGEECLGFLRSRVERFGGLSGGPARTLAWALGQMGRDGEGLAVMEAAVARRPEEGELLLAAADFFRDAGRGERAAALVAQAEHRVPDGAWWRRMAGEAVSGADLPGAIGFYRRLLESEPASREVHGLLAGLLAGTEGGMAAVAHLAEVCGRFPGHADLHVLWCEWLADDLAGRDGVLRHLLGLNPADAWALRELAMDLRKQGRHGEAVAVAREAMAVAPHAVASPGVLGFVLQGAWLHEEARECYRRALRLDADYPWVISELIGLAPDLEGKRAELDWILTLLEEQVTDGNGLMRWRSEAWLLREPEEILEVLERARGVRPDLWQAWSVLGTHLVDMGRMDEALEVGTGAAERFPFLPRVWYDLALIRGRRGDAEGERGALEQALGLSPRWEVAVRRMAAVCRNLDDAARARAVLERHARSCPSDTGALLDLVRLLRDEGEGAAAREACRRAVLLAPLSEEAWRLRASLAGGDAREEEVVREEAEALTGRLPHSLGAWECRASVAAARGFEAELVVLDEGLGALAGCWDLLDRKALLLSECGRYDEALKCCAPGRPGVAENRWRKARAADIVHRQGREGEAISQMELLAEEHPDYEWPVQRLVEWFDHRADHAAVLKWTERQTRLNPGQHAGWGFRAGALLALGRQEEAEGALRTAVGLEPGYVWAVKQLLTLELKRGDLTAAEKTVSRVRGRVAIPVIAGLYTGHGLAEQAEAFCRSAVALNGGDAASHEALGEALWTLGRRREAVEAWISAVELKPEELGRVGRLHGRAVEAGMLDEVGTRLHDFAATEPANAARLKVWLIFLGKDEQEDRYLRALDEALRRLPEEVEFADWKAMRLSHLRRYTEALEVCGVGDDVLLLRRRAWIEAERGNRASAIDLMEVALRREGASVFGLQRICDWLEEADRAPEAVSHAEVLVRVAPGEATSFGFLASALLRCGRKLEAEPHLFRALRMMPNYEWAGDRLFELQLERGDHAAAEGTLRMVREHSPEAGTFLKELRLTAALKDEARARVVWGKMLRTSPAASEEELRVASGILKKAGWGTITHGAGSPAAEDGGAFMQGVGAGAYAVWVQEEYGRKKHTVWKRFRDLPREELKIEAWKAYLTAAAESPADPTLWDDLRKWKVRWAIHRNRDFLRGNTALWANAVYFYAHCQLARAGRRWSADWRSRGGLESWMLANVAVMQESNRSLRRGREVREWCVANLRADHTTAQHRIRLAFLAAAEGKADLALTYLSDARVGDLGPGSTGRTFRLQCDLARLMHRLLDDSKPLITRRHEAAANLAKAIGNTGGLLTPGLHAATLRIFLPFALRRAGFTPFLWQLLKLIPTACGIS